MEETIKTFVENNGIMSARTKIEANMAKIKYDYKDRLFETAFYQEHPNVVQV